MSHFNWRVVSPNTLKAYTLAVKDFETTTGVRVDRADAESLARYQQAMESRGLRVNTIRTRLAAVCVVSGVKVRLPKKEKAAGLVLDEDQVRTFFRKIERDTDRELLICILLTGQQPNVAAHWISRGNFSTQEITRKVKRYARLAGLKEEQVNMRTLIRTGRELMAKYDSNYILSHILPKPARPTVEWKPLHGIGRRSLAKA